MSYYSPPHVRRTVYANHHLFPHQYLAPFLLKPSFQYIRTSIIHSTSLIPHPKAEGQGKRGKHQPLPPQHQRHTNTATLPGVFSIRSSQKSPPPPHPPHSLVPPFNPPRHPQHPTRHALKQPCPRLLHRLPPASASSAVPNPAPPPPTSPRPAPSPAPCTKTASTSSTAGAPRASWAKSRARL